MKRSTPFSSVLILTFSLFHSPLFGQTGQPATQTEEKPINVTADTLAVEESGTRVEAKGNVELRREETILKADEVRVNRATQEVEAKGKVSVEDPEGRMKGEAVRLNLEKETGEIQEGEIFLERGHLSVSGRRFQKFTGQAYRIDDGLFTTCLCESGPPHWKIGAERIELEEDGRAIIRGGTFYVMDIPVLYLPYVSFPARAERKTGFLLPRFGSSNGDGFRYRQPFFWAISKSTDATLSADVATRTRVGLLGELRKVFSQDAEAQLNVSYFNEGLRRDEEDDIEDQTIADQDIPRDRWSIFATHRHTTPLGWMTYSDVAAFSDDLFTRELEDRIDLPPGVRSDELRRSRFGSSRFGILKNWGDMHLRGEWKFFQDFIQTDARTFQKTPQLAFWGRRVLAQTPLEFRWRAEGVNYWRREGGVGLRWDLRPEIVAPFRASRYLFGSLSVAPRETVYHLYKLEGRGRRNPVRSLVEVRGRIGTSVGRVFDWNGTGLEKVKHVFEPELNYLFIPRSQQRDIPMMDGVDRIRRRNLVTFSLTNRLWGKFPQAQGPRPTGDEDVELLSPNGFGEVRELGQLKLALSYDADKERKGGDSLSDLDLNLRLTPADYLRVGVDFGVNPGPWQVTQTGLSFSITDPRPITRRVLDQDFMRPSQVNVGYRFVRRGPFAELAENANLKTLSPERLITKNVLNEVNGNLLFHLTDNLLFFFNTSFDSREARFTTNRASLKILSPCECWTVTLALNRTTNPSKTRFDFSFNLLGLGSQVKEFFR